mmetsp:Transcript_36734/g.118056  ORF Transcript_36734/g.118056 Transcript_36734/m.118056 type:complete len:133 (+) Transcript_36734:571-969(+)
MRGDTGLALLPLHICSNNPLHVAPLPPPPALPTAKNKRSAGAAALGVSEPVETGRNVCSRMNNCSCAEVVIVEYACRDSIGAVSFRQAFAESVRGSVVHRQAVSVGDLGARGEAAIEDHAVIEYIGRMLGER